MKRGLAYRWTTPPHHHPFHELGIVTKGKCDWLLSFADEAKPDRVTRHHLVEGDAILIPAGQRHFEEIRQEASIVEWTGFSAPANAMKGILRNAPLSLENWGADVFALTRRIRMENFHQLAGVERCIPLLLEDLLLLLHRVSTGVAAPSRRVTREDHLESARRFMAQNLGPGLSITQVARYHSYSPSHFEVLFTERYGISPKRYQQQLRLEAILGSLRQGARSPKELAERHGFSDAAYFCRWFRRQTGTTPKQWAG